MRTIAVLILLLLVALAAVPAMADVSATACPLTGAREAAAASVAVGDNATALSALGCALNANYRDIEARVDRIAIALNAGRYGLAASDASALRDLDHARFASLLGTTAVNASTTPEDTDTVALLGLLYWADANDNAALPVYEAVLTLQPTSAFAFLFRGSSRLYLGDDIHATADFQQAVNLDPNNPDVYSLIGSTYQQIGNVWDAMMALDRAIQLNPGDARSHYFRGMVLYGDGDMSGARAEFTQALASDPMYVDAYYDRARASYQLADDSGAMTDLDLALTINPEFDLALVFRGALHEWAGNDDRAALDYFAYTLAIEPIERNGGTLIPNQPASVSLAAHLVYHFTFEGQAGQSVQVAVMPAQQDTDPMLVVLAPDGHTPLAASDDSSPNVHDAVVSGLALPQTGTYTVLVTHSDSGVQGPVVVTFSPS